MPADVHAALERNRPRMWALCYRMTGSRAEADDLAQEAVVKAIERAPQAVSKDPTGWLLQLTTRICLDHLRRSRIRRRVNDLIDPLDGIEWSAEPSAENALVLREDVRYAIVVALQHLSGKQRAALILRDVCGRSLLEIAEALESNENAIKALLRRARVALARVHRHDQVDVPADPTVVERLARAIQAGSIEDLTALLAEDVWGVVDGGGIVVAATKPTFGRRAVSRQWANAKRKVGVAVVAEVWRLNAEPAIVVRLAEAPTVVVAAVHVETRNHSVVALRVLRDPRRLAILTSAWRSNRRTGRSNPLSSRRRTVPHP